MDEQINMILIQINIMNSWTDKGIVARFAQTFIKM